MTSTEFQLTRPLALADIPPQGVNIVVKTTEAERQVLAETFGVRAVHSLDAAYHVSGTGKRVKVRGEVRARIEQTCVVTLEAFEDAVEEAVDVDFVEQRDQPQHDDWDEPDGGRDKAAREAGLSTADLPDEIVDGTIDLGTLTAEFLALGIDPYPRKPGAVFAFEGDGAEESPFARLAALKAKSDEHQ
ncbi:YceD family protein [Chelatococcus sp. GCM10030263]|uniref:YceD family protein n=1 Tax=Chelatococcus sp. GCM10030263 TaxID=3273387 RepID=UPI00360DB1F0